MMELKEVILLGLVYFLVLAHGPTGARSTGPRIVNGTDAGSGEFPFMMCQLGGMVQRFGLFTLGTHEDFKRGDTFFASSAIALLYKGYYTCGGSIIDEEWILTAAHCVFSRDSSLFSVVSGTNDMDGYTGEETPVIQVIVHENYKPVSNLANDIAVLRLKSRLQFSELVQPVSLPDYQQQIDDDQSVIIMGWGYNKYKGDPMEKLQKAVIYVVSNQACAVPYSNFMIDILPSHLCAGTPNGGVGQCTGDSGGPLVVKGTAKYTQFGVISFSAKPCGIKGYPGVFTRVPYHRNWIQDKTGC